MRWLDLLMGWCYDIRVGFVLSESFSVELNQLEFILFIFYCLIYDSRWYRFQFALCR